jgi:hypothetical protein
MKPSFLSSLALIDASGIIILIAIVTLLTSGVLITLSIRARYALIARDVRRAERGNAAESGLLQHVVQRVEEALRNGGAEVNAQAIVEEGFQLRLSGLLTGERYVKALTGLVIIMGLVGTFYGLSSSIGRLTALLSGQTGGVGEVTAALTQGLTETLSGMSVAFTCSLFGIVSAVLLTLLNVFLSIGDRRLALAVQIESYLDNTFLPAARASLGQVGPLPGTAGLSSDARIERMVHGFGESVSRLTQVVGSFEGALSTFATNTRDFQQFNTHLKDNIQRMSLSFADLSQALQQQAGAVRGRERG